jgi:hypothetical protein
MRRGGGQAHAAGTGAAEATNETFQQLGELLARG